MKPSIKSKGRVLTVISKADALDRAEREREATTIEVKPVLSVVYQAIGETLARNWKLGQHDGVISELRQMQPMIAAYVMLVMADWFDQCDVHEETALIQLRARLRLEVDK